MVDFYYKRRNRQALSAEVIDSALGVRMGKPWKHVHRFLTLFEKRPEDKLAIARTILGKCYFIGITERLDEDLPMLFRMMGLPTQWENYRVSGQKDSSFQRLHPDAEKHVKKIVTLNEKLKSEIYRLNPLDVELYEYAKKLNQRQTASSPIGPVNHTN
jgi:hypothetical protein